MGTTGRDPTPKIEHQLENKEEEGVVNRGARLVQQRCRICAGSVRRVEAREPEDGGGEAQAGQAVCVFGEEGRKRSLQRNVLKYLHIRITSEDTLPKMVCTTCIDKLDGIHDFATMALRSQEKLKQELLRVPGDPTIVVDSLDSCPDKLEDRGLLHSILTKGSIDTSNGGESPPWRQRTPSTEEMEVKIDPMLFLQCALEQASSVDCSDYSDDDSDKEVTSYGTLTSEPTTNRAHKKKHTSSSTAEESQAKSHRDSNDNENSPDNAVKCNFIDEPDYYDDYEDHRPAYLEESHDAKVNKPHSCKVCDKPFASQLALQNHLWSHLPTTTTTTTPNGQDSSSSLILNGCGVENHLLGEASFICPICSKRISTKGNLKVHLETHRPKGKYGCDICGRIFKTQSNLFRHKEYHSNVQFPCSVCGRVYPTNSTLRAHSITHSDLRPHACPLCDKTFKRNQDLKFHINQHTGARPYQCPYCPKAFASSGNCFSHRKRMHPKEVNRDRQRAADLMR
ncbi:zinc finger protein 26-like [Copidosoma floridanum]|uniref:zinc finger protein 26-like n=1 Tax=Copidosoma floridanum TaxID=29053 RepID=UPI0006C9910E|nr:zinc finger protein 26-like [Copidosoma floridanum]